MAWDKVDFKVFTHPDGDSFARCWIRLQETREAPIVDQLLDGLPSGPIMTKVPRIIKVPEGEAWVSTENPLGEMGYYVVSKGDLGPFRVKIRSASFNNISWCRGC
jgi:NADH-quinone oxidoreductase subunit D